MSKPSVKLRLIDRLILAVETAEDPAERLYYERRLRELRARGSGALPWWAKDLAYRWRIE